MIRRAHALAVVLGSVLTGCDSKPEEKSGKHEHKAPHAGTLVVFGNEFAHLELVLDPATGGLTGYLLDGEAEHPVRAGQKTIVIRLKANPSPFEVVLRGMDNKLTGETIGDTSQFEGQSDGLKGLKDFDGWIGNLLLKGKAFADVPFNFPRGNETD